MTGVSLLAFFIIVGFSILEIRTDTVDHRLSVLESELIKYAKIVESQSVEIRDMKQIQLSQQNAIEKLKSTNAELLRGQANQKSLLRRLLKNTKSNYETSKYKSIPEGEMVLTDEVTVPIERGKYKFHMLSYRYHSA